MFAGQAKPHENTLMYFGHMASSVRILNEHPGMAGQLLLNLRDASTHQTRPPSGGTCSGWGGIGQRLGATWEMAEAHAKPLGEATEHVPAAQPVLACILRAAMPFIKGCWTCGTGRIRRLCRHRKHHDRGFDIEVEYPGRRAWPTIGWSTRWPQELPCKPRTPCANTAPRNDFYGQRHRQPRRVAQRPSLASRRNGLPCGWWTPPWTSAGTSCLGWGTPRLGLGPKPQLTALRLRPAGTGESDASWWRTNALASSAFIAPYMACCTTPKASTSASAFKNRATSASKSNLPRSGLDGRHGAQVARGGANRLGEKRPQTAVR